MRQSIQTHELSVSYGKALLLHDVGIEVREGELVTVVGPNGAGKTTLLRALAGLVRWDQRVHPHEEVRLGGRVWFLEERIDELLPHEIAARGLILCPERRRPFQEMTVRENLLAGAYLVRSRREVAERLSDVYRLFPLLRDRARQRAGTLSGGEQQMLAIARALMGGPKLLLVDEPSTGLAPLVKEPLFSRIRQVKEMGVSVLLVEQDAAIALSLADWGYVLSQGRVVAEGPPENLLGDEVVRRSYLGL